MEVTFTVNGSAATVAAEPGRSLLEVLREDLGLTGTKYGCGEGACGACTVLLDGRPVRSCILPVEDAAGKAIVTIEGIARDGKLSTVQEAFVAEGASQCGYCTPGMVLETAALLEKNPRPADAEIVEALDGHLCRCCNHPKILKAVRRAAGRGEMKI